MAEILNTREETNHKVNSTNLRRYWRFWLPITIILALMVKFPLRIDLRESFLDALFYGSITLTGIATAVRVYRRFGEQGRRLIAVTLLCSVLSGWQIFDMVVLRQEISPAHSFASGSSPLEPLHNGWAWYNLRFPNPNIVCNYALFERYVGNHMIAIVYEINRDATWFSCGG